MQSAEQSDAAAKRSQSDPRQQFGRRLRELRIARGYSQEELADRADLDRTYISGIERGRRNVSLLNIWRLAGALDTAPATLLEPPAGPGTQT
jgi:transcriptional regulator with XRE-family HTH domain